MQSTDLFEGLLPIPSPKSCLLRFNRSLQRKQALMLDYMHWGESGLLEGTRGCASVQVWFALLSVACSSLNWSRRSLSLRASP